MASRPSITVRIFGQDYRIASEGGAAAEEQIHSAASLVDDTMRRDLRAQLVELCLAQIDQLMEACQPIDVLHQLAIGGLQLFVRDAPFAARRDATGFL